MDGPAIAAFLPTPEQITQAMQNSSGFRDFLALAVKSSGLDPRSVDFTRARFRVADPVHGSRDNLRHHQTLAVEGRDVLIHELLAVHRDVKREQLVYALWALSDFDQIKDFLRATRALVRYAQDVSGDIHGHILLAESLIPMIDTVERREYILANGDMASDAITRNLGLRAKVFALDRERRAKEPGDGGILDRLSRTFGRLNNR